MATNTTLQYLETTGEDAFGASVSLGASVSNRRQIETFIQGSADAIAVGDLVAFDIGETGPTRVVRVVKATTAANGNALCVGVAHTASTNEGDRLDVVVAGYAATVTADAAGVAAGNPLTASKANAATVTERVAGDTSPAFGVALETIGAGATGACWIYKQF
tara:strand:+ start:424 stop:909 length:486 start_codon:yes stop_codon:yes gene_type:complete